MKKWLTMLVMVSMLATLGGVQPAQAAKGDFDAYFEQAAIFPVDFNSRVYVKGDMVFLNGPVEMKEGVLYVSSVFLDDLLKDHYILISTGTEGRGEISFIPSEPGQTDWSYEEGDPVAFTAYIGETRCVVWDEAKTLAHAPYRMMLDNGTPYAMLPLRDVAGALGLYCAYQEGLIVLAETAPNTPLEQNSETLQMIKAQLTQPFVGCNDHHLAESDSGIMIYDGEEYIPAADYDHIVVYEAQDSKGQKMSGFDDIEEATTTIVKKDLITGESQVIAKLPNGKIGYADQTKTLYRFFTHPRAVQVPEGYLIWAFYFGGNAQSSNTFLFYAADDGRVIQLSNGEVDDYYCTDEAVYYCLSYINTPIGRPGWLYRFGWSDTEPQQIGDTNMDYRQIAGIDGGKVIAAASVVGAPEQVKLYRLDLTSGEQQLVLADIVGTMAIQMEKYRYFQIADGEIYYISAADGKLYALPLSGGQSRLVAEQPPVKDIAFVGGMLYGLGQDGHLYQQSLKGGKAVDVSGCKVKDYAAQETRVYYIASGYQAGLYLVENGQTQKLLAQPLEGLALDQYGTLAVQPTDACAEYYLYREGKLQTVTLR